MSSTIRSAPRPDVNADIVIDYRDWLLAGDAESSAAEFMSQDCIVYRFQQSWAEGGVDAKGSVHDFFSDLVLGHDRVA